MIRTAIVMRFASQMSQEEIAKETNLNHSTISHRLRKGLDILRRRLSAAGAGSTFALTANVMKTVLSDKSAPAELVNKTFSVSSIPGKSAVGTATKATNIKLWIIAAGVTVTMTTAAVILHDYRSSASVFSGSNDRENKQITYHFDFETDSFRDKWQLVLTNPQTIQEVKLLTQLHEDNPSIDIITTDVFGTPSTALRINKNSDSTITTALLFFKPVPDTGRLCLEADIYPIELDSSIFYNFTTNNSDFNSQNLLPKKHAVAHLRKNAKNHIRMEYTCNKTGRTKELEIKLTINNSLADHQKLRCTTIDSHAGFIIPRGTILIDNIRLTIEPLNLKGEPPHEK